MTAFTYRMSSGVPGDITRQEGLTIEAQTINTSTPPTIYGNPVKLADGKISTIESGDSIGDVYGLLVRPFPTNSSSDGLGTSTPPTSGIGNVLKRGYLNVKLNGTTPAAKGGTVYVRLANASSGKPIGGFEAADDSTNTDVLPNAYFTGPADSSGNTEIAFNI